MISKYAIVETDRIGKDVEIGEFAVIRSDVVIGNNVIIHPHVVISSGVYLGDGVEIFPGAFIGKEPKGAGALARTLEFKRQIIIGDHCSIGPHGILYYGIKIGNNTLIGDGASIREGCEIGTRCIIGRYTTLQFDVHIGNGSRVIDHSTLAGRTVVGENVFISWGVYTTGDVAFGREKYDENETGGPIIHNGVSIGAGAILNPRIQVRENAVIGAGSVVTKDIEANTVVMGVPARFVRETGG